MSRYCGERDPSPILEAATHWRDVALVGGKSVLTSENIWTSSALEQLDEYFVKRPELGNGTFKDKLAQQLDPTNRVAKKLAAEMMWLLYLCPSSLTPAHKRKTIQTIWAWSGENLTADTHWLNNNVLIGVGSAGPGFNQNQARELSFLINFTVSTRQTHLVFYPLA